MSKMNATFRGCGALAIWSLTALCTVHLRNVPIWLLVAIVCAIGFFYALLRYRIELRNGEIALSTLGFGSVILLMNQAGYLFAFKLAPAAHVDLIYYLWPILVLLSRGALPGQRFESKAVLAALFGLTGVYLVIAHEGSDSTLDASHLLGYGAALAAAISWMLYTLYASFQSDLKSGVIGLSCGPAALIAWIMHSSLEPAYAPTNTEWGYCLFIGLGVLGLSLRLWDQGIKRGHFVLLNTLSYSVPICSIAFLIAAGRATASPTLWLAAILVSLGPLIIRWDQQRQET